MSNLYHYLQNGNEIQYEDSVSIWSAVNISKSGAKWQQITQAVGYHIAKGMVPIAIVDKCKNPQLLTRKYLAREMLPEMHTNVQKVFSDRLAFLD